MSLEAKMTPGREYELSELPGFTAVEAVAFAVAIGVLVASGKVHAQYIHIPTGARYQSLMDIPLTYGDPPQSTGLDDIKVVFARLAPRWRFWLGTLGWFGFAGCTLAFVVTPSAALAVGWCLSCLLLAAVLL